MPNLVYLMPNLATEELTRQMVNRGRLNCTWNLCACINYQLLHNSPLNWAVKSTSISSSVSTAQELRNGSWPLTGYCPVASQDAVLWAHLEGLWAHLKGCWRDFAPQGLLNGGHSKFSATCLSRAQLTTRQLALLRANPRGGLFAPWPWTWHPTPFTIFYALEAHHQVQPTREERGCPET